MSGPGELLALLQNPCQTVNRYKRYAIRLEPPPKSFNVTYTGEFMIKKVLLAILLIFVVAILGFVAAAALQPDEFTITRSASMNAAPEIVFEQINDFHKWESWSPWAKMDPEMKVTYSGAESGVGAVYEWSGNSEVGSGKMTITQSRPSELVKIDLEFTEPFAAKNVTEFILRPETGGTSVTWTMTGKNNLMAKAFGLVMNMDKMIGSDLEKGLAQIKSVTETTSQR